MGPTVRALAFESAPDSDVYLVTGILPAKGDRPESMAAGYVFASDADAAAKAQLSASPDLRLTGVVSLAELKEQARLMERARLGEIPALATGVYASDLLKDPS